MEGKQNPSQQIQRYRPLILMFGLVLNLLIVLIAFEYKSIAQEPIQYDPGLTDYYTPVIPRTIIEPPKPPQSKSFKLITVTDPEEVYEPEVDVDITFNESDIYKDVVIIDEPVETTPEPDFVIAETPASFNGGAEAWIKFLRANLKYPKQAKRMGIEGTVHLSFFVDATGNISDIAVTRGIGAGCDDEAIRVLKKSPKWNPGKQRGRAVKSPMAIRIVFKLN